MTGQELIDAIQHDGDVDHEVYIQDANGNLVAIKGVTIITKRDPYDGDWDTSVTLIETE